MRATHQTRKRHIVNLSVQPNREPSLSFAFKIWMVLYAMIMAVGILLTSSPQSQAQDLTPSMLQSGSLLFHPSGQQSYIEAPRVMADYAIDIAGPIARVKVQQSFHNATDKWQEGLYVFPLPEDAAVDQLRIKIGDRIIKGEIKTRKKAKQLYEQAKLDGKKASLIEQQRPNIFTNSIANIGPNETIVVEIEYQQAIAQDS